MAKGKKKSVGTSDAPPPAAAKDSGSDGEAGGDEPRERLTSSFSMEPEPVQLLRRIDAGIGFVEQVAVLVFLAALIAVGTYQAILGNVFNRTSHWTDEVVRYSVFFIAMSGAALAAQRQRMITMDILTRMMSARARAIARVVIALFVAATACLMIWGGWVVRAQQMELNIHYAYISPSVGLLALPIGAGLIGVHYLLHAVIEVIYLVRGEIAPEDQEVAAH